jgi:hypothetical protein
MKEADSPTSAKHPTILSRSRPHRTASTSSCFDSGHLRARTTSRTKSMSVLSSYLVVTGGNVTGLTDDSERDGLEVEIRVAELCSRLDGKSVRKSWALLGKLRVNVVDGKTLSRGTEE